MKFKLFPALLVAAALRFASAAPTHIHDVLPANTDGSLANGSVVVSWPTFTGTDGVQNTAGQKIVTINGGVLDTSLPANSVGVNYTAIFNLAGSRPFRETWHIPDSASDLILAQVIVPGPTAAAPANGAYRLDPAGLAPGGGMPGQVLTLNSLLQWRPATVSGTGGTGSVGPPGPQGPAGPSGPTGPAGPNNNLAGQPLASTPPTDGQVIAYNGITSQYEPSTLVNEDNRKIKVSSLKPLSEAVTNIAPGATVQLLNVTGAGNVSMIQLALVGVGGSPADKNDVTINSTIQICTNGEAAPCQRSDVGTFFLAHGVPTPPFSYSDNFTLTEYQDGFLMGAFRRIMIPFTNGCTISLINKSNVASGKIFSQVYYQSGTPPTSVTGTRKKTFHMATVPFTGVAQYNPLDLANISGRGAIEGIHFFVYTTTPPSAPTWLEGAMDWTMDGSQTQHVQGTEDFFGGQYYWGQLAFGTNSWGIVKNGTFAGSAYATGMYRIYDKDPMVFDSGAKLTWHNGTTGQGATPPGAVNVSAIVFYYLDR